MTLMCYKRGIMRLHGSMGVWRQLRPSNQWWRHTFLIDTSRYNLPSHSCARLMIHASKKYSNY